MAARRWPALTKKGTDCRLCREKGDGVFCHHHASGNNQWWWAALRALRFAIYCFLGFVTIALGVVILDITWGLVNFELRLLYGFPSIFALKSNLYRCSSLTPGWRAMQVAYHEAGHALVEIKTEGAHPIKQVTIVRGRSYGGYVIYTTRGFKFTSQKQHLIANMDVCMGARAAEELIYGYP